MNNELFLDRSKTHYIKDKDKTLEIMFDAGMKVWYVRVKAPTIRGFFSKTFPNEMELCKEFPFIKDYIKKEQFASEMRDIINEGS